MIVAFHAFGPVHLAVIGAVQLLAAALARQQRSVPAAGAPIRYVLAVLLLINFAGPSSQAAGAEKGRGPELQPRPSCSQR